LPRSVFCLFASELQNPKARAKECEARDVVVSTLDSEAAAEEAIPYGGQISTSLLPCQGDSRAPRCS
jgi:hypothetical protein